MILFKLLKSNDFYGCTENIEIAKGKYKMPETLKEVLNGKQELRTNGKRRSSNKYNH